VDAKANTRSAIRQRISERILRGGETATSSNNNGIMAKPKYIETPEKLWGLFMAYKEKVKNTPIIKNDFAGKDADEVFKKLERPLTMEGFECYCFDNDVINDLGHYFSNHEDRYKDYLTICRAIKKEIRRDQIEGGMAGIYNPSITQRLNGLVDKTAADDTKEVTIKVKYDRKGTDDNAE
jgi:hypothetical protein